MQTQGQVVAVSCKAEPGVPKKVVDRIHIKAGWGVEGDYHAGIKVRHRYLQKTTPDADNHRQVHLMHAELFDELAEQQIKVLPGNMGENITTQGIDILNLPPGTYLHLGDTAVIEVTEVRTPCSQLNAIDPGLLDAVYFKLPDGTKVRKSGIMARAIRSGWLQAGDPIRVELEPEPIEVEATTTP